MFESVIGPRVHFAEDAVHVWMVDERPQRLVYRRDRWTVEGTPEPIVEVPDELFHPLITHPTPRRTGWRCTVRRVRDAAELRLAIRREAGVWRVEVLR
ncbi:hypothetical protein [Leucobacter sp.]